ncbi:LCP family protein [Limosilactobacillus difficilis]|uniref:LCP family protein n=1 Tax=Limosilactobacillus difficilis TaxID=2991838 RepID=UPI0024B8B2B9|nr:LCP family protein [Limosilactobacillus difficilis]
MVKHETREQYRERIQQDIDQQVNQTESYDDQPIAQPSQTTNDGGNGSNNNGNNGGNNWHPHRTGGWLKAFILLIILVILGAGGVEYHRIHSTAKGIFGAKSGKINPKLKRGEPISVLLMGTDVGALNRGNKGGNTDTLELMTINPKKQRISMTSIPRDTLVRVNTKEGADYVKINAAYSIGGPKQTCKQVSELLNVPVNYYAVINMGVLKKVVNAVGGVDVNNPFAFTYEGHHFKKGQQHLNGELALKYSRMRYSDPNNDYGRQRRQQQIMSDVITKFKENGSVSAVNKILDAVKDGVKTNVPIDNVAILYANYHAAMNNVSKYHFQGKDATIEGVSFQIASPKEINRVSKLVRNQLGLPYEKVHNYETWMYHKQHGYNGVTNTDFELPNGAEYNVPGSGGHHHSSTSGSSSADSGNDDLSAINVQY